MPKIILATTSPYRKEIFGILGIPFEVEGSKVDESQIERNNPEELVKQLSKLKAEAVAKNRNNAIVIGFDSVGFFNGKILEKPKTKQEAFERLQSLSGNMKKLFLASVASNTIDRLIEILPKSPDKLKVAFIPTAADPYEDKWFVNEDRNKLKEKGFTVKDVDIKGRTKEMLKEELDDADIIFVAGGNTFYLLEKVRESGLDNLIKELIGRGIIYVGSSAGATLVGPNIEPVKLFDDSSDAPSLQSFNGLNLVDFIILPHFDKEKNSSKYESIIKEYADKGYKLITLTDNQAVIVEDDKYKIVEK